MNIKGLEKEFKRGPTAVVKKHINYVSGFCAAPKTFLFQSEAPPSSSLLAWELRAWGGKAEGDMDAAPSPPHPCMVRTVLYYSAALFAQEDPFPLPLSPPCLPTRYSYDSAATDSARTHKAVLTGQELRFCKKKNNNPFL